MRIATIFAILLLLAACGSPDGGVESDAIPSVADAASPDASSRGDDAPTSVPIDAGSDALATVDVVPDNAPRPADAGPGAADGAPADAVSPADVGASEADSGGGMVDADAAPDADASDEHGQKRECGMVP
ncbi:MAG TPA: hypothetical protein VK540_13975 [Polyangiaceae bacterium]|nr:hypothetical protein [Polyangiaceae bacterium]